MEQKQKALLNDAALLVLLVLAVYGRILGHEFITTWDDSSYILENPTVRGFTLEHLHQAFSSFYVGNYAPLQMISYMLDYTLWGLNPAGFAAGNLALHAANGVLLLVLLQRVGFGRGAALAAAAIFLVHPVQVESVAWFSQRKNLLAMTFFLGSFLQYLRWREEEGTFAAPKYLWSLGLFALSLLTKAVVVVLPLMLLLYDRCYLPESRPHRFKDKVPFFLLAGIMAAVTLESQQPEHAGGRTGFHGGSPWTTLVTMLPVIARYVGLFCWPAGLSAAYAPKLRTGIDGAVLGAAALLCLLAALGALLWRRERRVFFWYAAFWIGFLPVLQVVPIGTLMNDRYFYFPMVGGAAALAGACSSLAGRVAPRWRRGALSAAAAALVALAIGAGVRAGVWHDPATLWQDAVRKEPGSVTAWNHLGVSISETRGLEASLAAFSSALKAEGQDANGTADTWNNLAATYSALNRDREAVAAYRKVLEITPNHLDCLANLGLFYLARKDTANAALYLERLVRQNPGYGRGYELVAELRMAQGKMELAEADLRRALALGQRSAVLHKNLGLLYLDSRRPAQSREAFQAARELEPENPDIPFQLAKAAVLAGDSLEARRELERALALGLDPAVVERTPELAGLPGGGAPQR
jgi:protein O-mannosyl-transferase